MNLSEIRNKIRLMVPEANTTVISNSNLDILINDGALDIVKRTDCLQNYDDQDVTADQQEYTLPTDAIKVLAVWYGGSEAWEKLPCITQDWLANEIDAEWMNKTTTIYGYYLRADKVGLYQIPTSAEAGTDYLRIFYTEQPDTLSEDSNIPFNSQTQLYPYHELIMLYGMYKIKQILGKWEQAKVIETDYLMKCAEMRRELQKLDDFLQPITPYYKGGGGSSIKQNPLDQ